MIFPGLMKSCDMILTMNQEGYGVKRGQKTVLFSASLVVLVFLLLIVMTLGSCKSVEGPGDVDWQRAVGDFRHDLVLPDMTIHYIDLGQGEPIVMVHGFADSTYCWHRNYRPLLEAGFRLVIVDQPGLGRSIITSSSYQYTVENQAAGVKAVMDHLELGPCHFVGHSMGGGISLFLAVHRPELVRSLVLLDPACFRIPQHRLLGIPGIVTFLNIFKGKWILKKGLAEAFYDKTKITGPMITEYSRPLAKKGYIKTLRLLVDEYFSAEFDRMVGKYPEIRVPTFILWGDHDTFVPTEYGPRLQRLIPGSRLVILDAAGHNAHQEQPELTNGYLLSFLGDFSCRGPALVK